MKLRLTYLFVKDGFDEETFAFLKEAVVEGDFQALNESFDTVWGPSSCALEEVKED